MNFKKPLVMVLNVLKRPIVKWSMLPVMVIVLAASVQGVRAHLNAQVKKIADYEASVWKEDLEQGRALSEQGNFQGAYTAFQNAIKNASTPEAGAEAAYATGEFLLRRGRWESPSYVQMGRAYLESALKHNPTPEKKFRIYKALIEAAVQMRDLKGLSEASAQARALATSDGERANLMLNELDAVVKIGSWSEYGDLENQASGFRTNTDWQAHFQFREAQALERALIDDLWYQAWLKTLGKADPITARSRLYKKTIGLYDGLAQAEPEYAEESLYRAARLACTENQFDEARRRIREFFDRNYHSHEQEFLLMLIRMARLEGNTRQTASLISQFLRRYQWYEKASSELLALIEQAESVGHLTEAYDILTEFLKTPGAKEDIGKLEFKAGQLAVRLKRPEDEASRHFDVAMAARTDDDTMVECLVAKAGLSLQKRDLNGAQILLIRALTEYPFDSRRGKALYQLVDVFRKSRAPLADVLLVSSLAVDAAPNDPAAVDVVMQLAGIYEELGLFSKAQEKYAKVALLYTVETPGRKRDPDSAAVSSALLGSARCLIQMGDSQRADRILRELVRTLRSGAVYSEAVYLWATIEIARNQKPEALRRLDMLDSGRCPPDIRIRARLERMIIEVSSDEREPESVVEYLQGLKELEPGELDRFAKRAYATCFERLQRSQDLQGMQDFIDSVAGSVPGLPISSWAMDLASRVLSGQGVPAFIECVDHNLALIEDASVQRDMNDLMVMATSAQAVISRVTNFTR